MTELTESEFAKWQKQLEAAFVGPSDIIGERVKELEYREREHLRESVSKLQGLSLVMDSFFDFAIQTFREAFKYPKELNPIDLGDFIATFWRFRSSYNIFWEGYYFDAISLLRAVYESILCYGAINNGFISRDDIRTQPNPDESQEDFKKRVFSEHNNIDHLVRNMMVGKDIGLDDEIQESFRIFIKLLHKHVHRSYISAVFVTAEAYTSPKGVSFMPTFDEEKARHYGNVAVFLAWCFSRLFQTLLEKDRFSSDWNTCSQVLDDAFATMIVGSEKPFSEPIRVFMDEKFGFCQ